VDVVIDTGKKLIPVEVKSGETVDSSLFDEVRYFTSLGAPASETDVLIHGGEARYQRENFIVRSWYQCA
jgi:hypothetical protein